MSYVNVHIAVNAMEIAKPARNTTGKTDPAQTVEKTGMARKKHKGGIPIFYGSNLDEKVT